jgi:hypothetical protein
LMLTWNVCIWRVVGCVGAFELRPSWALAHHHVMRLSASFRLQRQQCPVGWRLACSHLPQRLTSLDLCVNLKCVKVLRTFRKLTLVSFASKHTQLKPCCCNIKHLQGMSPLNTNPFVELSRQLDRVTVLWIKIVRTLPIVI